MVRLDRCDVDEESKVAVASLGGMNGRHLRECPIRWYGASSSLFKRLLIDSSSKTLKKSVLDCHVSMLTYIGYLHRLICTRTINYEFLCVCVCFRRTKNNTTLLNEEEFVIFTSQFLWETICFKYNMLLMLLKSLSLWRFMVCEKWLTVKVNIHSQWSLLLYYIVYSCSQFDRFLWYIFNYAVQ